SRGRLQTPGNCVCPDACPARCKAVGLGLRGAMYGAKLQSHQSSKYARLCQKCLLKHKRKKCPCKNEQNASARGASQYCDDTRREVVQTS
ncbi:MAG: hypothetical protein ACKPKO_61685, partial [Candidatus Fonsibacter sp.]